MQCLYVSDESMDGNRDESEKCIQLAKIFAANSETQKAIKYLIKAQRLYPSQAANDLLEKLQNEDSGERVDETDPQPESTPGEPSGPRSRSRSNSFGRNGDKSNLNSNSNAGYSQPTS
ncbi:unnamed protein product, partial [Medioppia subpectinata]